MFPTFRAARAGVLASSAALAAALTGAVPATAATAAACPDGMVCLYSDTDFQGRVQIRNVSQAPGCKPAGTARSVVNNTALPVHLYVDGECTQYLDRLEPGDTRTGLAADPAAFE
ncbi:peptidase inhibitor family I36 protein [Streptomyces sp. NPDC058330]|uniref:peptidase inhibitor family I36 protein n=1 Tax=Streptomyces sp. NPDC058330 TaxID=3346449 RepID=UPI0036E79C32